MQRCRYTFVTEMNCIQWNKTNFAEISELLGGKVAASPFSRDELTIRGGSSYVTVSFQDWILWDSNEEFTIVDHETFKRHYQLLESEDAN